MNKTYTILNDILQKIVVEHDSKISSKDIAKWYCNKFNLKPGSIWIDSSIDSLIQHDSVKPFVGYIAFRNPEDYHDDYISWCITKEDYWNKNHYLDDREEVLSIPDFNQSMENTYEYEYGYNTEANEEQQIKMLEDLGFKVLDIKEWNND